MGSHNLIWNSHFPHPIPCLSERNWSNKNDYAADTTHVNFLSSIILLFCPHTKPVDHSHLFKVASFSPIYLLHFIKSYYIITYIYSSALCSEQFNQLIKQFKYTLKISYVNDVSSLIYTIVLIRYVYIVLHVSHHVSGLVCEGVMGLTIFSTICGGVVYFSPSTIVVIF